MLLYLSTLPALADEKPGLSFRYQSLAPSAVPTGALVGRTRGLPQVAVTAIAEGPQGFLWVGTQNGLARFDGLDFEVFDSRNTPELTSTWIEALFLDADNRLWVATTDAILLREGEQLRPVFTDRSGIQVSRIDQTDDGQIWFAGDQLRVWSDGELRAEATQAAAIRDMRVIGDTLFILDEANQLFVRDSAQEHRLDPSLWHGSDIQSLNSDAQRVYLATKDAVFLLPPSNADETLRRIPAPSTEALSVMAVGSDWAFGVTTSGAIYQLLITGADYRWEPVDIPVDVPVSSNSMESLVMPGPLLWIGTQTSGLHSYWSAGMRNASLSAPISKSRTWSVAADEHVHMAADDGIYTRIADDEWRLDVSKAEIAGSVAYSYWSGEYGEFVGTRSGLFFRTNPEAPLVRHEDLGDTQINAIKRWDDVLWLATMRGLYEYNPVTGHAARQLSLGDRAIRSFIRDSRGDIWVGTQTGLYRWSGEQASPVDNPDLSSAFVDTVIEFDPGWLAVATFGDGLFVADPDGEWMHFDVTDGLPFQDLFSASRHGDWLWVTAASGIVRLKVDALKNGVIYFDTVLRDDGLFPSRNRLRCCNGAGDSRILALSSEQLLIPTANGPLIVDLDRDDPQHQAKPVVTAVGYGSRRLPFTDQLDLELGQRDIDIAFAVPDFGSENLPQYRYRLLPQQQEWVQAGDRKVAYFTNLDPGTSIFEVEALVDGADWLPAQPLAIHVAPYFYETWYARVLMVLALMGVFWLLLRYRTIQLKAQALQLEQTVEARTAEVRAANATISEVARDNQRLIRHASALIMTLSKTGEILEWNKTAERLTGWSRDEVIGANIAHVLPEVASTVDLERLFQDLGELQSVDNLRVSGHAKDGKRLTLMLGGSLLPSLQNMPERLVLVGQDLTKQLEREQQLIQASRIANLGVMATGMAHEINQPLNAIKLATVNVDRLMDKEPADNDRIKAKLARILEQITRASRLIEHLKLYGRRPDSPDNADYLRFDVRETIQTAMTLLRQQLAAEHIELQTDIADQSLWVVGDPLLIEQVLINLVGNSRDAIRSTRHTGQRERFVAVRAQLEGNAVMISVEDDGGGVSDTVMRDMFEPFFTTKDPNQGAGLGLSIAHSSIKSMSGRIWAENTAHGLKILIELPSSCD